MTRLIVLFGVPALLASNLAAQFGIEFMAENDPDRPPQPPTISLLAIVSPGKMANDPSLPLKGAVAEVTMEELRTHDSETAPAGAVMGAVTTKYDERGLAIEELRDENGAEADTVKRYQGSRLVSQETTFPKSKDPLPKLWNYWTYDPSGKLTEYRRGAGDTLQNHLTNFKRDPEGRLASFEYHQGTNDELFCVTEFHYSADGKTVDMSSSAPAGMLNSTSQTVDDQGRIVQMVTRARDSRTRKLKPPRKVAFRYDTQGRLVEQTADDYDLEAGSDERSLPPGKVSVEYDDVAHTKTTAYSLKELGEWSSTVTYDATGAAIAKSFEINGRSGETRLDCAYDSHGNWTNCAEVGGLAGANVADRVWRRTITYR